MSAYTDGITKINKELLKQVQAVAQNSLTQAALSNNAAAEVRPYNPYANQLHDHTYGSLGDLTKRSTTMLKHGDIIVSEVANGMTVTVYRGEGALPDVYVATAETISDVIKLARVNTVLNRAK